MKIIYFLLSCLLLLAANSSYASEGLPKLFIDYDHKKFNLPKDLDQAWNMKLFKIAMCQVTDGSCSADEDEVTTSSPEKKSYKYAHSCQDLYQFYKQGYVEEGSGNSLYNSYTEESKEDAEDEILQALRVCQCLQLKRQLKPYTQNYLGDLTINRKFIEALPGVNYPRLGEVNLGVDNAIKNGTSLGSMIHNFGYSITEINQGSFIIDTGDDHNQGHFIKILGVGDWNGDGVADLVISDDYNADSTMDYNFLVLTRLQPKDYMRIIYSEDRYWSPVKGVIDMGAPEDIKNANVNKDLSCAGDHFDALVAKLKQSHNSESTYLQAYNTLRNEYKRCADKLAPEQIDKSSMMQAAYKLKLPQDCKELASPEIDFSPDEAFLNPQARLCMSYVDGDLPQNCIHSYLDTPDVKANEKFCTAYVQGVVPTNCVQLYIENPSIKVPKQLCKAEWDYLKDSNDGNNFQLALMALNGLNGGKPDPQLALEYAKKTQSVQLEEAIQARINNPSLIEQKPLTYCGLLDNTDTHCKIIIGADKLRAVISKHMNQLNEPQNFALLNLVQRLKELNHSDHIFLGDLDSLENGQDVKNLDLFIPNHTELDHIDEFTTMMDNLFQNNLDKLKIEQPVMVVDKQLNEVYHQIADRIKTLTTFTSGYQDYSDIRNFQESELAWIKYKQALISFSVLYYGNQYDAKQIQDIITGYLTQQRLAFLNQQWGFLKQLNTQ